MKKIIISLCAALLCNIAFSQIVEEDYASKGGVVSKGRPTYDVTVGKGITSFEVTVPSSGLYYFNFWLLPPMLPDKTFATYDVAVDGKNIGRIIPEKNDWHTVGLEGNRPVMLQEGNCKISIIGDLPCIPNVELVRLSKDIASVAISDDAYQKYRKEITEKNKSNNLPLLPIDTISHNRRNISFPLVDPQTQPPYDGKHVIGMSVYYTFFELYYFYSGQTVSTGHGDRHLTRV